MRYPKILDNSFRALATLTNNQIVRVIKGTVTNGMTIDILVGNVANILLSTECNQHTNLGTYNFKKALLIRVKLVVDALDYKFEDKVTTNIDKDGHMYVSTVSTIIDERDETEYTKVWFNDPKEFTDSITLKGSKLVVDNNSTKLLQAKSEITLRVKEINPIYLDLYTALIYEVNKGKVDEANYKSRLQAVADETKGFMGYAYTNYRKLDSNSRNYPLNRYGFAVEYGDSFEKFLIEPAQQYLVDQTEINGAIAYLESEFKTSNYKQLVYNAMEKLEANEVLLEQYNKGYITDFTITHKELGKLLHIVDIYHNIIDNLGNLTRSCASYDFTNSGGINAANQFGNAKFLKTMNLLGEDEKFDTHQRVADVLGIERDDAKSIMQGPNHGGQVPTEYTDMVEDIFGETYKYIRLTAEYGAKLAHKGVKQVTLTRPDGVTATWYPYTVDCSVSMEDGSSISAIMPYGGNGTNKQLGLAVSCLHSADAFTENYIQAKLAEEGIHIKTTLDNFYGRPSIKDKVVQYTFESLEILRGQMEQQLKAIELETGIYRGWNLPDRGEIVVSANIM